MRICRRDSASSSSESNYSMVENVSDYEELKRIIAKRSKRIECSRTKQLNLKRKGSLDEFSDSATSISEDSFGYLFEDGAWIQCAKCEKWFQLPPRVDPAMQPLPWICSGPTCQSEVRSQVDQLDDNSNSLADLNLPFSIGSIVWAKTDGFPWWPGMVDINSEFRYLLLGPDQSVTHFNVIYCDKKMSRSWVKVESLRHFKIKDVYEELELKGKYCRFRKALKIGVKCAEGVVTLSVEDRISQFADILKSNFKP